MVDLEIEAQTIAAMLNNQECLDMGVADIKEDWIHESFFRYVFKCIKTMYIENKPVTAISVYTELGCVAKERGTSWLMLKDSFFTKSSFDYYVQKLRDLYKVRELVKLSQNIINRAEQKEEVNLLLRDMEDELFVLTVETGQEKVIEAKECAYEMMETLSKQLDGDEQVKPISTSYEMLNYALNGGFRPSEGQLIILAAKTGKGKTAMAMNIMRDVAVTQKKQSLYVNTEMGKKQLHFRWMTMLTPNINITHSKIATPGGLTQEEGQEIMQSIDRIHKSGFDFITVPDLNMTKLISIAKRYKSRKKMEFMVVDYVGRLDTTNAKLPEHVVLKNISKQMKTLAQQLGITIIMLAQLNDDGKIEGAKAMKNEADMFAYLEEVADTEELFKIAPFNYYLVIDKNRDGKSMKLRLKFIGEKITFVGEKFEEVKKRSKSC